MLELDENKIIVGLPIKLINKLNIVYYEETNKDKYTNLKCLICQEEFAEDNEIELVGLQRCTHIFHKDCIVVWLKGSKRCPICKDDITSET